MKLRTGRRNHRNLYLQLGDEPSEDDPCLGLIIEPKAAHVIVDAVNKYGVPRVTDAVFTGPHRVRHAVIGTEGCCVLGEGP